jgi:preprotein translocase subunit SecG
MYYLLVTLYVLTCLVLSLVILLQQGRGGDIASAFGGSGSQAAFGARSGATLLTKATTVAAVLFMILALTLSIIGQHGGRSVVSGTSAPAPVRPAAPATPAPAPANSAPATPAPAPATK